ncbi:hypothetical protein [Microbacterium trichothecenolyticum]|uniref:Uncharacterized protein n=1 Tax=Microbacterium trichothecenolyticum TaxID=69370 RepID=A0ABU0TWK6_MICTR|nr:hypothetical protein [Microbacterium trichothecenolyticum]MDQ1124045.1 hypothetical protein [Microbacterium trichothecenolyticum]
MRAPWDRPGESSKQRAARIVLFSVTVVCVVVMVSFLVYFVTRSAEIAGF